MSSTALLLLTLFSSLFNFKQQEDSFSMDLLYLPVYQTSTKGRFGFTPIHIDYRGFGRFKSIASQHLY
jgi:hypothetical protein